MHTWVVVITCIVLFILSFVDGYEVSLLVFRVLLVALMVAAIVIDVYERQIRRFNR